MKLALAILLLSAAIPIRTFVMPPPGIVIDHQPATSGEYIGSPSIVIAPNGDYVATHDLFGPKSGCQQSATTRVFVSHDRGATWKQAAEFRDQFWSNLFLHRGRLYLMGTNAEYGRIVIRSSTDNGQSWSAVSFLTADSGYHTAPVPVAEYAGRLWRAFEFHPTGPWGSFQAFLMSAPLSSDITKKQNWSFTNRVSFPASAEDNTWLEGNAIIGPDGSLRDMLRVDGRNKQRAAMLKLQGNNLLFDHFVDFPGGATKFTIRFDPKSHLYWTLVNPALSSEPLSATSPGAVRNTLALSSSPDLNQWTIRAILIHHADAAHYGFQYVDWQFQDNDIIFVSRTAFDDKEGGAHTYHDANFLTFHRIVNFRKLRNITVNLKFITAS